MCNRLHSLSSEHPHPFFHGSGPFDIVAVVQKEISEYVDTTASKEIIYYYKVRARTGNTYSPYSNTVTGER